MTFNNETDELINNIYTSIKHFNTKYDKLPTNILLSEKHIGLLNESVFGNTEKFPIHKFMGLEVSILEPLPKPIICII